MRVPGRSGFHPLYRKNISRRFNGVSLSFHILFQSYSQFIVPIRDYSIGLILHMQLSILGRSPAQNAILF
jgi:hypothetical protein